MNKNVRFWVLATWFCIPIAANTGWAENPASRQSAEVAVLFATTRDIEGGRNRTPALIVGKAIGSIARPSNTVGAASTTRTGTVSFTTSIDDVSLRSIDRMASPAFLDDINARLEESTAFGRHVLVVVHGFNTGFEFSVRRSVQIAHDIGFDGVIIAFSWSSHERLLGYLHDQEAAIDGADRLLGLLKTLEMGAKADKISLIAHSMGTVVGLDAVSDYLRQILEGDNVAKLQRGEIVLAAPDISEEKFLRYHGQVKRVKISVYTSNVDLALRQSCDGRPCMGYYSGSTPTLVDGVDVLDVSAAGNRLAINHNIPFESALVLSDVRRLLLSGRRPPHARTEAFEAISVNGRVHWRLRTP